MGLYDTIKVSKETIDALKIVCPRCHKAPAAGFECQSKSIDAAMGEFCLRVTDGKVRLFKDTGDFWTGPSGKTVLCPNTHGWIHMYGFCDECQKSSNKQMFDVVLRFTNGAADKCQTIEEGGIHPLFGIEVVNESS